MCVCVCVCVYHMYTCISTLADSNSEIRCRSLIGSRFRTGDGTSASSHPADLYRVCVYVCMYTGVCVFVCVFVLCVSHVHLRHRLQIAERETI